MTTRTPALLRLSVSIVALAGLPSIAAAEVAIGLYNPFNHGFHGVNEIGTDRVEIAHNWLFPSLGDLADTDYTKFQPFYGNPSTQVYLRSSYSVEKYETYRVVNVNPFASHYRQLHVSPQVTSSTAYFDVIEELSSAKGSPGFSANSGAYTLASPNVDTGVGSATDR